MGETPESEDPVLLGAIRAVISDPNAIPTIEQFIAINQSLPGPTLDDTMLEFAWHLKYGTAADAIGIVEGFSPDHRPNGDDQWTLLGYAVEHLRSEVVRHLVGAGADVKARYSGRDALAHVVDGQRYDGPAPERLTIAAVLIDAGADLDLEHNGMTTYEKADCWPEARALMDRAKLEQG